MGKARKKPDKQRDAPRYEDVRSRLEEVVAKLERGEGTLEENLSLYEEGVGLVRSAHEILDGAEKRLHILKPQPDGSFRLEERTAEFAERAEPGSGEARKEPPEEDAG